MSNLTSKNYIRQLLADNGLFPKKHFGQNFLCDSHVLSKIVAAADLSGDDFVIEIGPGLGVLTTELAKTAKRVVAVEIDRQMADILRTTMADNVEIVREDVLKVDWDGIFSTAKNGKKAKVIANLPYYITSPIIFGMLEKGLPIDSFVVMVQKEVADRFLASPGTKAYGLPSLSLAYYGKAELVANVPPHSFFPRPDVHSAVIKIDVEPRTDVDASKFFPLIRAAFANRRKTFVNCLANSDTLGLDKERAAGLLEKAGLRADVRGEALNFEDFVRLVEAM
ncbi:MAG: 16S rRNA (adenine(1518)-N(6)/adenine(1519)-N(6))-dimethyltransferase RsmA [Defluviitaleaceae bacterium]|nr:16S rRNA (adenine(1518)-N(6)/adenine(1519)-N(6))-dimethyltransferase RsmA [Defluviitaleaceae bacterium]